MINCLKFKHLRVISVSVSGVAVAHGLSKRLRTLTWVLVIWRFDRRAAGEGSHVVGVWGSQISVGLPLKGPFPRAPLGQGSRHRRLSPQLLTQETAKQKPLCRNPLYFFCRITLVSQAAGVSLGGDHARVWNAADRDCQGSVWRLAALSPI